MVTVDITIPIFAIVIFYIMVAGKYIGELSGIWFQKLMANKIAKHFAAFITLFLFVVIKDFNTPGTTQHPITHIWITLITYTLFMATTQLHIYFIIPIFILVIAIIILFILNNHYKTISNSEDNDNNDNNDNSDNSDNTNNTDIYIGKLYKNSSISIIDKYLINNYGIIEKYMTYTVYGIIALGYLHYIFVTFSKSNKIT